LGGPNNDSEPNNDRPIDETIWEGRGDSLSGVKEMQCSRLSVLEYIIIQEHVWWNSVCKCGPTTHVRWDRRA
jgi:hypothetical protein